MLRTYLWSIGRGLVKLDEILQKESVLIRCMVLGGFFSAGVVGTGTWNMFHRQTMRHRLNMLRDDLVFYKEQKEAVDRAAIIVDGVMERMFDKMARELTDIKGKIVNPENGKEARPKEVGPDAAAES